MLYISRANFSGNMMFVADFFHKSALTHTENMPVYRENWFWVKKGDHGTRRYGDGAGRRWTATELLNEGSFSSFLECTGHTRTDYTATFSALNTEYLLHLRFTLKTNLKL